mgnify:CR=1 FL=1
MTDRSTLLELAGVSFATIESTQQRPGESEIAWANRPYRPSFRGSHRCGGDHDANRVFAVFDIPVRHDEAARRAFEAAKAEGEVPGDDWDVLIDLNLGEGHVDDFGTTRQLLPRVYAAALRALANQPEDKSQ